MLPHLVKKVWQVWDQDAPGARLKFIAQPAVKVSLVSAPPSADVLLLGDGGHNLPVRRSNATSYSLDGGSGGYVVDT